MHEITPFLWFDHEAEEAMNHYVSIFKNSKVLSVNRMGGRVMSVTFELDGQRFMGLNAGPKFKFNEAISFFVDCETQVEVDELWEKLSVGGEKAGAAGSRTSSDSRGRLFLPRWGNSWVTRIPKNRRLFCRRCSR